ncbi:hypothetical protein NPIL_431001 [Nephila pilipes]|uniref:Uncharacterized protein n=1 Tax=Nephila pilipes TaxID=299642 RepID=A0A8X6QWZ5_NEPPI|nr:hypothetical protein NPIL_431001 [Nephila pilipes]
MFVVEKYPVWPVCWLFDLECIPLGGAEEGKKITPFVRSGVRTHALFREPELKSGALDRSAILTTNVSFCYINYSFSDYCTLPRCHPLLATPLSKPYRWQDPYVL